MKVNEKSEAIKKHESAWAMIRALMGGTQTMRGSKTQYLPQWPAEEQQDYERRLNVSTLYPSFKRTAGVMTGKPFGEPIVMGDDVPPPIVDICEDIDLEGNDLHTWCASTFLHTLAFGYGGILVDFPVVNGGTGARTVAEEKATGARPYFVHIKHHQILGFKVAKIAGKPTIVQLRLMECVEEDDGEFGTVYIEQVRVLMPGAWQTWREKEVSGPGVTKAKEWVIHEEGTFTLQKVPFVFLYGIRTAFGDAEPPLLDLGYLNVKHWQSQSDQDNILHIARVPILAMIGANDDTPPVKIGQGIVKVPMEGDLKYVEHTGASIDAGEKSLEKLEMQMVQTGAELLVMKPGQRTATETNAEGEGNKSDLQRIVDGFEDSVDQALQLAAEWLKLPEGGHVEIFDDFGAWSLDQASGTLIKDLTTVGLLSKETALKELQRRGIISGDIDPAMELQEVEEQGPPLGSLGDPGAAGGDILPRKKAFTVKRDNTGALNIKED